MDISIRQIEPTDISLVVELLREFAAYENLTEYCEITVERLGAAMFGPGAVVEGLIAFDGEAAAAYALYYPNFSSFRGQRGLHLEDIYIKSQYRRANIGEKMLRQIARTAASRGLERIDFFVLEWNKPAVNFYEKLGAVRNDDERHFKFDAAAFKRLAT